MSKKKLASIITSKWPNGAALWKLRWLKTWSGVSFGRRKLPLSWETFSLPCVHWGETRVSSLEGGTSTRAQDGGRWGAFDQETCQHLSHLPTWKPTGVRPDSVKFCQLQVWAGASAWLLGHRAHKSAPKPAAQLPCVSFKQLRKKMAPSAHCLVINKMELEQNGWKAIFGRWISERIGHHLCNFSGAGNGRLRPCQAQWLEEALMGQKERRMVLPGDRLVRKECFTKNCPLLTPPPSLCPLRHYRHHRHHYHHRLHQQQPYRYHHHCHAYWTNWLTDALLYTSTLLKSPISLWELPPFKSRWGLPCPHYVKLQNPSPLHSQMLFFPSFPEA